MSTSKPLSKSSSIKIEILSQSLRLKRIKDMSSSLPSAMRSKLSTAIKRPTWDMDTLNQWAVILKVPKSVLLQDIVHVQVRNRTYSVPVSWFNLLSLSTGPVDLHLMWSSYRTDVLLK